MKYAVLPFIAIVVFLCGCRNSDSESTSGDADFQSRLAAARTISDTLKRDKALSALALDAAKHGEGEIVKEAISLCVYTLTKDKAASDAALKLAKAGQGQAAVEVAQMISSTLVRDDTLKSIAE